MQEPKSIPTAPALVIIAAQMHVDDGKKPKRQGIVAAIVEQADLYPVKAGRPVQDSDAETRHAAFGPAVSADHQAG